MISEIIVVRWQCLLNLKETTLFMGSLNTIVTKLTREEFAFTSRSLRDDSTDWQIHTRECFSRTPRFSDTLGIIGQAACSNPWMRFSDAAACRPLLRH